MKTISIGKREIGPGAAPFIMAEVGQNHDGSLGMAHAYIDAVADAGADAVKFQTHIAAEESTYDEPFRVKFSRQDATRYEYWRRMEFSREAWAGLAEHAGERGLLFLSTPFSVAAVELLSALGMPAWKVSSGEVFNEPLLRAMGETGRPILMSSGMSAYADLDRQVAAVGKLTDDIALFQCTSAYPVSFETVGLNVIGEMRARYGCPVGLSDHSGTVYPGLAAMAGGADMLEVHVAMDKREFGPDIVASVTVDQLSEMVKARDAFHVMATHPVDKDAMAHGMANMRSMFSKSLATRAPLDAGAVVTEDVLTLKRPGTGISPEDKHKLIGRKLRRNVSPDRLLRWEDFGDEA